MNFTLELKILFSVLDSAVFLLNSTTKPYKVLGFVEHQLNCLMEQHVLSKVLVTDLIQKYLAQLYIYREDDQDKAIRELYEILVKGIENCNFKFKIPQTLIAVEILRNQFIER